MSPSLASLAAIRALGDQLNVVFKERTHEVTAMLVALLAGEHVLLLGPPGTGKSAITQALAAALPGRFFERLMTRFTVPEELFGPFSVQGLKADRYERKVDGYLPTATVAFLDEIFKAGSPILNALLTMLNERAYDQGSERIKCPLAICIGASNELPEDGLDALADRFLFWRWVAPIASRDNRRALLASADEPAVSLQITEAELAEARAVVRAVTVPDDVIEAVMDLRDALARECAIEVSDRRLRKCMKALRAYAALQGRTEVVRDDLLILVDCLWRRPEARAAVQGQVVKIASPALAEALKVKDAAIEAFAKAPKAVSAPADVQTLARVKGELIGMRNTARGLGDAPMVQAVAAEIDTMVETISRLVAASFARQP